MKTPWSTLPICHGPAITPQRSIVARTPKPSAYSVSSSSAASFVAPYSVRAPSSGKSSAIPCSDAPATGCTASSAKRVASSRSASRDSGATG